MELIEATIEEFEQGAWVADLVSFDRFAGSFDFAGETWTGTMFSERQEGEYFHTRVIGGANGLAETLLDKFYDGNITAAVATQDVCRESGETFGEAQAGKILSTFERLRGPAYAALDAIGAALTLIWWIGRDGRLNMKTARASGPVADGTRVASDVDSVELVEPENVAIGGTYDDKPIRHVRWRLTDKRYSAQIYFLPFIFRSPVENRYSALESARVDRDNGDGTIDVIVGARYGLKKIRLFCGVPGAKVLVRGGEEVQVGYFGGDPQKPFAVSMAQNSGATKEVARNSDAVKVTIPAGSFLISCSGSPAVGVLNPAPIDVNGTIQAGSARMKVGD